MLPNRFAEEGVPEFNSVDAALWYVIAVRDWQCALANKGKRVPVLQRRRLDAAVQAILTGYASGTRHGIRLDSDGLLAAGEPGIQLTWMDAKVGDRVITPRIGKPVEVQALWLNALDIGSLTDRRWLDVLQRGRRSFEQRFWNEAGEYLHDVVDVDHRAGAVDDTFRPNQIFAVGGLPLTLLNAEHARRVVNAVEQRLLTPLGLRSLARDDPAYVKAYRGGPAERDAAYHQGAAWPWLIGAFVDAWVRVRGSTDVARAEARQRFLEPLLKHVEEFGLGHVTEIADPEPPFEARGCPFQAWSLGELLRISEGMLREPHAQHI
jgi:predicted glycogen debranching enzyme